MKRYTFLLFVIQFSFLLTLEARALEELKVTTYNLGLAHTFVPLAKERLPHLISSLKESDADVICMQEVWIKKDRARITRKLKSIFPYSFQMKIKQKISRNKPTCAVGDLFGKDKFVSCLQTKCKGAQGDDFTDCVIEKCRGSLERLKGENPECAQGMIAQVGKSTLGALLAVLNPFKGAGLFSYKGSDGLIILSKKELFNNRVIDLSEISTATRRRMLLSSIKVSGKEVTIGCSHLTANLSRTVPYTGEFSGWDMENLAQVEAIIEKTKEISTPLILAGDYNCSIENMDRGIKDEFSKSCKLFLENGFFDRFLKESGACTYCEKNTLVKKSKGGDDNFLLDHIFTKNIESKSSALVFDELISIERKDETIKANLSDHFGVSELFQL